MDRKKAIETVRLYWPIDEGGPDLREAIETLVPELKESEDERMKKFIATELACLRTKEYNEGGKGSDRYGELTAAMAWIKKSSASDNNTPDIKYDLKFNVGDWIVGKCGLDLVKVVDKRDDNYSYVVEQLDGTVKEYSFDIDNGYRLWNVEDAKPGDVLANDCNSIFINAGYENEDKITLDFYCFVGVDGKFYPQDHKAGSWYYINKVYPATKAQYDELFIKMREAGYEWNHETKKLKKINSTDDIKDNNLMVKALLNCLDELEDRGWNFIYVGEKDIQIGVIREWLERINNDNFGWREEDVQLIDDACNLINTLANGYGEKVTEPITFAGVQQISAIKEKLRALVNNRPRVR